MNCCDNELIMINTCYIGWRLHLLRENFTQQTQAPANRNARSKQWQPWLAACQRKRLRYLRFSFTQRTQRTQRKRLRLNGTGLNVVERRSSVS